MSSSARHLNGYQFPSSHRNPTSFAFWSGLLWSLRNQCAPSTSDPTTITHPTIQLIIIRPDFTWLCLMPAHPVNGALSFLPPPPWKLFFFFCVCASLEIVWFLFTCTLYFFHLSLATFPPPPPPAIYVPASSFFGCLFLTLLSPSHWYPYIARYFKTGILLKPVF